MTEIPAEHLYATFSRRLRALVLDFVVLTTTIIAVSYIASVVRFGPSFRVGLFAGLLLLLILYEPLLVAFHGRTIGHRLCNLRVVAPTPNRRLRLDKAFVRWLLKGLTGLASFATMGATQRNQALHDLAFGTTVEIADPARARPYDFIYERPSVVAGQLPSRFRRALVIMAYLVLLSILLIAALTITISQDCLSGNTCRQSERMLGKALSTAWLAGSLAVCIFGWQGRIPGARRRPAAG